MAIQNVGNKPGVKLDQTVERPSISGTEKVETPELKPQEEARLQVEEPSGGESREAELWKDLDPQAMFQNQPEPQAAPQSRQEPQQPQQEAASGLNVSADEVAEAARQASGLAPSVAAEAPAAPQVPAGSAEPAQPESANMLDDLDLEASGLNRRSNYTAVDPGTRIVEEADEGTPQPQQRKARTAPAQFDKDSAHREEKKDAPDNGVKSLKNVVEELFPKVKKRVNEVVPGIRSRRTRDAEKKARENEPKATVSRKGYNGQGVYAKITGDASLDVNEISIGSLNIREGLAIPNSEMAAFLTEQTGVELTGNLDVDVANIKLALDREFVEAGVFKSPNLEPESSCKMRIKVHSGRDLRMNPLSFKKFNADTDGDEACISFDEGAINRCVDSMLYLLNLAGDLTLDPDFFPFYLSPTGLEASEDIKDATLEYIEQAITHNRHLARVICDMYFSSGKEREGKLAAVVQELYDTCKNNQTGQVDTRALARLLSKTYRALRDLRISQFGYGRDMLTNEELLAVMPSPASNADRRVYDFTAALLDEVTVKAEGAANFQDLRAMMHDYLGEPDGTNPSFRFTANIAKMFVNIDERVQIGGEVDVSYEELLEGTIKFVESRKISERLQLGQKARQAKEILSERIIKQVGFLPNGTNTGDFLRAFIAAYKENAALINAANVKIMTDFGIKKVPDPPQLQTIGDIARALRDVYGDIITVGMLVGNQGLDQPHYSGKENAQTWTYARRRQILDVYGTWTLNKFAKDNKYWESDSKDSRLNKNLEDYAKQQDGLGVWTLIGALANMRTSTAKTYDKEVYEKDMSVCDKTLLIMCRLRKDRMQRPSGNLWQQEMQMELELLNASDPDVYSYFGMDNIKGFFNSKYGEALYKATTAEEVKTIRLAMNTEYRMSSIHRLITRLDEGDYKDAKEAKQLVEDVRYEQELLASSSWAWSAVVKDSRQFAADDDSRPFQRLRQGNQDFLRTTYFKRWDSLENYNTLEEVLLSLDLTKGEKCDIVADVVRYYEQFKSFMSYQVPEQLEHNPNPVYSNVKPTSVGVLSATKEFNKQYDRQQVRLANLSNEIGEARAIWESTPGALTDAISFLANNKHSFCQINTDLLSDAMCAVLDKAYPQSEKNQQHVWTNAFYTAMSMARSGGFFSDVYRTDDRAVGLQSVEYISPHDIVCVLSGQKRWCYDEQGQVFCLTRESLVGKDEVTEEDLWDFLQENLFVASYIRAHSPTPIGDGCYMGAIAGIGETIGVIRNGYDDTVYDEVLFELADDPRFAALVALVTPIQGKVSRDVKPWFQQNINRVIARIAYVRDNRDSHPDLASAFGVTQERLEQLGVEETEAEKMVGLVNASLEDFIRIIGLVDFSRIDEQKNLVDLDLGSLGVHDLSACYAYYDVRQELSGSKTQVSTGINGYETHNLTAFITALDLEDRYASFGEFDDLGYLATDQLVARFGECQTSLGKTVSQFDAEDWARFDRGDEIIIEMPPGKVRQDKSLGDDPRNQVPSVYSYLLVKRDAGAEKFNLKAKKTGDDGLHSVTKDGKYFTLGQIVKLAYENGIDGEPDSPASNDYGNLLAWLEGIYDSTPENMFAVKLSLAKRLLRANRMCKYDEVTLADCMNLADIMVIEVDGALRLRSISSVARSIKASFDYDLVRNGTKSEIHEVAVSAAARAGAITEDVSSVFAHLRPTSNAGRFSMIERPRSSSLEMNIAGLESLREKNPGLEYADKAKHALPIEDRKFLKSIEKLVGKGYFIAGADNYAPECIGPQALWVFSKDPTSEQLEQIKRQGVTALLPNAVGRYPNSVLVDYGDRLMQLIPGFDIAVNGSSYSDSGFGTFRRPADNIVWMYEDAVNEHGLGDAGIQLFKSLVKRLKVNWKSTTDVPVSTMFANTFAAYPDATFKVTLSSAEEVYKVLAADDSVDIDVGLAPSARGFEKHWDITMAAIDRYVEKYKRREQDFYDGGLMLHGNRPGDVVAWMTCEVDDHEHKPFKVYAPVIPFDLTGHNEVSKAEVPSRFDLTKVSYNIDNVPSQSYFTFDWAYTDNLNNHALKFFEGQSTANKFYTSLNKVVDGFKFANGVDIDCCVAPESTASRRIGSNKRLGTMQSLVLMARTQGYNFAADCRDSFPGEQMFTNAQGEQEPIKERLEHGYMTIAEWRSVGVRQYADPKAVAVTFSPDPEFDYWIKRELIKYATNGGNPTDVLCCRFDGAHTDIWWDVECMLETSTKYQDGLMRFFNSMTAADETPICAESTADHGEGYLFKCDDGEGFDSNCLKMQVPHRDPITGRLYRSWENVYGGWSFFNFNDFTGAHRPNVNGYSDTLDAINTHALSGRTAKDEAYRAMLEAAMSEVGDSAARPSFGVDVVRLGRPQVSQAAEDASSNTNTPPAEDGSPTALDRTEWGNVLALTGHRPQSNWGWSEYGSRGKRGAKWEAAKADLWAYCQEKGIDTIVSGMAQGWDTMGAEVALEHGLKLVCAIPYENQAKPWPKQAQDYWTEILAKADLVVDVSSEPGYQSTKKDERARVVEQLDKRNHWMVDNADSLYAFWNGSSGGTGNAVEYAKGKLPIRRVFPQKYSDASRKG